MELQPNHKVTNASVCVHNSTQDLSVKLTLTNAQLNHVRMGVAALQLQHLTLALVHLVTQDQTVKHTIHAPLTNVKMVLLHKFKETNVSVYVQLFTLEAFVKLTTTPVQTTHV